ncbi:Crotonobetainyl-CoA:carnitine CoA-transferase CaiB [Carboxydocella sporoproducens DSM 16521]|uniref:Crotonobetainyl-CoA:carnitine CoA-transferase CaiB n=2 Tax=Carboxydocella TaxID=178898 RepID=A0A1T4MTE7_9FIRM|nr:MULTISPECIES: CoA transferase [Carboxydocella]AVX20340.1 Crotonobetainyl-CoA:carnitine CoA-transferase CaiB [Carboxydocella thermautotrophica]AVX30764.1 Crotonobetainyl-CoA:carnitine CoA-transferase CaiB [Carboxydocella thermautotrophica]GAW30089.1 alpha-methylacyl-CoA racemase [Carboxydocella sp. ULO1]SJZ70104.1 Crotonobetainyl-CoA:carnitine CoA-transferase CaiB [Carboxydocella sporoproducens DSM 16521]
MLDGVTVLELAAVLPGRYAGRILADLGARVVRVVEPAGQEYFQGTDLGRNLNEGKETVFLDLNDPEQRQSFFNYVSEAQVLLCNFRPERLKKLNIEYKGLKKYRPDLVCCLISGFGQNSIYGNQGAHDLNFQAMSGLLFGPHFPVSALSGALWAVIAVLAGLYQQQKTGEGIFLDIAILAGMLEWSGLIAEQKNVRPTVNNWIYATKDDGQVAISALERHFWRRFCERLARPDLLDFYNVPIAADHPAYITLVELFASKTRQEWEELLADADCCFSSVLPVSEALTSCYLQERRKGWPRTLAVKLFSEL